MSRNLVDSSGWLEYFADTPNAPFFARAIERVDRLVVPTISILEVFRTTMRQRGRYAAYEAVAQMRLGRVIDLDRALAISSARLGLKHKLPTADSVVYATALAHDAVVWTQDADFDGLAGVRYQLKR